MLSFSCHFNVRSMAVSIILWLFATLVVCNWARIALTQFLCALYACWYLNAVYAERNLELRSCVYVHFGLQWSLCSVFGHALRLIQFGLRPPPPLLTSLSARHSQFHNLDVVVELEMAVSLVGWAHFSLVLVNLIHFRHTTIFVYGHNVSYTVFPW